MCKYVLLWRWTRSTVTCTVATIEFFAGGERRF